MYSSWAYCIFIFTVTLMWLIKPFVLFQLKCLIYYKGRHIGGALIDNKALCHQIAFWPLSWLPWSLLADSAGSGSMVSGRNSDPECFCNICCWGKYRSCLCFQHGERKENGAQSEIGREHQARQQPLPVERSEGRGGSYPPNAGAATLKESSSTNIVKCQCI